MASQPTARIASWRRGARSSRAREMGRNSIRSRQENEEVVVVVVTTRPAHTHTHLEPRQVFAVEVLHDAKLPPRAAVRLAQRTEAEEGQDGEPREEDVAGHIFGLRGSLKTTAKRRGAAVAPGSAAVGRANAEPFASRTYRTRRRQP